VAGSKSDYLEKIILDLVLGASAYSAPGTVYIALSTAAYSDAATGSSMTEVSGGSYVRLAVTNNSTNWPAASGTSPATKTNGTAFTFVTATGSWGTVASFYIVDASTAGNVLYGGDLSVSKAIASGDTATFASSTGITVTED
jgi:hypothetical protein